MRMPKVLLLFAVATGAAHGALTTITDTLKNPDGTKYNGRLVIQLNQPGRAQPLYNTSGQTLTGFQATVTVTNGAFSLQLEANDAIVPSGTSYGVRFVPAAPASTWLETWVVPTSGSPLKISAIRSTETPQPTVTFSPAQLSSAGASSGQALVWSGSSWQPASVGVSYTASAVIDLIAVPDGSCVLDTTAVTVANAALGQRPSVGSSFMPPEGVNLTAKVTGPNSMRLEICNHSGAAYDAASATYYFGAQQ